MKWNEFLLQQEELLQMYADSLGDLSQFVLQGPAAAKARAGLNASGARGYAAPAQAADAAEDVRVEDGVRADDLPEPAINLAPTFGQRNQSAVAQAARARAAQPRARAGWLSQVGVNPAPARADYKEWRQAIIGYPYPGIAAQGASTLLQQIGAAGSAATAASGMSPWSLASVTATMLAIAALGIQRVRASIGKRGVLPAEVQEEAAKVKSEVANGQYADLNAKLPMAPLMKVAENFPGLRGVVNGYDTQFAKYIEIWEKWLPLWQNDTGLLLADFPTFCSGIFAGLTQQAVTEMVKEYSDEYQDKLQPLEVVNRVFWNYFMMERIGSYMADAVGFKADLSSGYNLLNFLSDAANDDWRESVANIVSFEVPEDDLPTADDVAKGATDIRYRISALFKAVTSASTHLVAISTAIDAMETLIKQDESAGRQEFQTLNKTALAFIAFCSAYMHGLAADSLTSGDAARAAYTTDMGTSVLKHYMEVLDGTLSPSDAVSKTMLMAAAAKQIHDKKADPPATASGGVPSLQETAKGLAVANAARGTTTNAPEIDKAGKAAAAVDAGKNSKPQPLVKPQTPAGDVIDMQKGVVAIDATEELSTWPAPITKNIPGSAEGLKATFYQMPKAKIDAQETMKITAAAPKLTFARIAKFGGGLNKELTNGSVISRALSTPMNVQNVAFFPTIMSTEEGFTVIPYAVVYGVFPDDSLSEVLRHTPQWVPFTTVIDPDGAYPRTVTNTNDACLVDVALLETYDSAIPQEQRISALLSVQSALNLSMPAPGTRLFFVPWVSPVEYEIFQGKWKSIYGPLHAAQQMAALENAFTLVGPSMGMAVVAAVGGFLPVAYTGYVNVAKVGNPSANKLSQIYVGKATEHMQVATVANIKDVISPVEEIPLKTTWATVTKSPLVIPFNSPYGPGADITTELRRMMDDARRRSYDSYGVSRIDAPLSLLASIGANFYSAAMAADGQNFAKAQTFVAMSVSVLEAEQLGRLLFTGIRMSNAQKMEENAAIATRLMNSVGSSASVKRHGAALAQAARGSLRGRGTVSWRTGLGTTTNDLSGVVSRTITTTDASGKVTTVNMGPAILERPLTVRRTYRKKQGGRKKKAAKKTVKSTSRRRSYY